MRNKLEEILFHKLRAISALENQVSSLRKKALARREFKSLKKALESSEFSLIAEIKKASPSAGVISHDYNPQRLVQLYEKGGAHAISVLTEENFFLGSLTHLKAAKQNCSLPVLRKDFIIHRNQLYESCAEGADAVLLIVAALPPNTLRDLYNEAKDLQLDVIVEVHTMKEVDLALKLDAEIIGINNRDLSTFEVNLRTTFQLAAVIPDDRVLVSESGIQTQQDVLQLRSHGVDAILVGETLMRSQNPVAKIKELLFLPNHG